MKLIYIDSIMSFQMYNYGFRGLDRRVIFLALSRFIRATGRVSTFLFLPLILIEVYRLSFIISGLIIGSSALVMALVQYYSGRWTDRIGRRFFLIIIPIPAAVFYLLMFFSVFDKVSVVYLLASWYGTIITNSLQYPAIEASVADITKTSQRLSGFTLIRIMANMGAAIGPLIGGFISYYNFAYIFLVASVLTVVEIFILYYNVKETYFPPMKMIEKVKINIFKTDHFFFLFTIIGILLGFALRQDGPTLTVYAFDLKNLPIIDIGYIYSINGLMVIALQMPILRIMSNHSNAVFWRGIGSLFYAAGFGLLGFRNSFAFILVAMFIFTIGEDFMAPTTQTIITTLAPADKKGTYIGSYNLITSSGRFFGTFIGLYLLYVFRYIAGTFWFYIAVATIVISFLYIMMGNSFVRRISVSETDVLGKA
ncbi:MAG: MDR family MFS transporter [Thermoplasmata archaeon]